MNTTKTGTDRRSEPERGGGAPARSVFVTTHWSVVLAARDPDSDQSARALETLCRTYWYPLYAYVRRFGHSPHDAQDLTQEFFARLLARRSLDAADRDKGRFRTFLLTALKRFMANEWQRAQAQKRGGLQPFLPLDTDLAERLYQTEPSDHSPPDKLYERRCALLLLDAALMRLEQEYTKARKSVEFDALKPHLTAGRGEIPYRELAVLLRRDERAARVAVHRFRKRYRDLFREQVVQTVARPEEVEDEMHHLLAALAG